MYRRRRAVAVLVAAALAGSGVGVLIGSIGGNGGAVPISGSAKAAVETVFAFQRALAHHDWSTICNDLYSDAARTGAGGAQCPANLAAAAGNVRQPETRIISVFIHRQQASVTLSAKVAGGAPVTSQIHMIREHGDYRIIYAGAGAIGD